MTLQRLVMVAVVSAASIWPCASAMAVGETATAKIKLANGSDGGTITMMEATAGVIIKFDLSGLPPGPHAIHVHEASACEGDFASAGNIYNPLGAKHGFLHDEGPMSGDLPNIHVSADGKAVAEFLSPFLTLSKEAEETLFDSDGSSFVIFEKADDYESEPEGGAGVRIACGAITGN